MTLVMKLANYVIYTNPVILYIFLFEYAVTVMCFCFFLRSEYANASYEISIYILKYWIRRLHYRTPGNIWTDHR